MNTFLITMSLNMILGIISSIISSYIFVYFDNKRRSDREIYRLLCEIREIAYDIEWYTTIDGGNLLYRSNNNVTIMLPYRVRDEQWYEWRRNLDNNLDNIRWLKIRSKNTTTIINGTNYRCREAPFVAAGPIAIKCMDNAGCGIFGAGNFLLNLLSSAETTHKDYKSQADKYIKWHDDTSITKGMVAHPNFLRKNLDICNKDAKLMREYIEYLIESVEY